MTAQLIKGKTAMRREAKEQKEATIYSKVQAAKQAGSLMTDICDAMTKKYGFSKTTFYALIKSVANRTANQTQQAL